MWSGLGFQSVVVENTNVGQMRASQFLWCKIHNLSCDFWLNSVVSSNSSSAEGLLLPDALPRSSMALPRRVPEARRACNKCAHLTQNHIGLALTNARCHTQGERGSTCGCIQSEFGRDLEFPSTLYSRLQSQAVVFCRGAKPQFPSGASQLLGSRSGRTIARGAEPLSGASQALAEATAHNSPLSSACQGLYGEPDSRMFT